LRTFAGYFKRAHARRTTRPQPEKAGLTTRLLKGGAAAITILVAVVVTVVLLSEVINRGAVVIKPFLISPELQGKYNDQIVANLLTHNISVMIREAKSVKRSQGLFNVPISAKLPEVQVPGGNISTRSLMRYVQEFAPLRYLKRRYGLNPIEVEGEALLRGDRVTINLRISKDVEGGPPVEARTLTGSLDNLEPLIVETSQFIMAYAEPYLWAAYLYQKKRPDEALAWVQYCLRQDPAGNKHMALSLWGLILIDQGKFEEAIAKLEEATQHATPGERDEELAAAYNNWGLALLYECKTDEAFEKFEEAIRHDPNLAVTYNNYGKAFLDRGEAKQDKEETKRGIEKLEHALALDRNLATAYYNLAYAQSEEKPDDAIALYLSAIRLDPEYVDAYSGLGLVLGDVISPPRTDEALERLNKAIELDKTFAPAYANRGLMWANKEDYKRAIVDLEEAVRLYPSLPEARRGCVDFTNRHARAHNNLGWVYEEDKNYEAAVANYQKAIDLDRSYYYAYTGKGDALRKAGRPDEALVAYESVIGVPEADEKSRFTAYKGKALALSQRARTRAGADRRADLEQSVSMWEEARKLRPNSKEVQDELAKAGGALASLPRRPK
jgi:tetratricopeptide (TPR) repeat protein